LGTGVSQFKLAILKLRAIFIPGIDAGFYFRSAISFFLSSFETRQITAVIRAKEEWLKATR
jgi:hypothetical protein